MKYLTLSALLATLALSACGNKEEREHKAALEKQADALEEQSKATKDQAKADAHEIQAEGERAADRSRRKPTPSATKRKPSRRGEGTLARCGRTNHHSPLATASGL